MLQLIFGSSFVLSVISKHFIHKDSRYWSFFARERAENGLYLAAWVINVSFALNFDYAFPNPKSRSNCCRNKISKNQSKPTVLNQDNQLFTETGPRITVVCPHLCFSLWFGVFFHDGLGFDVLEFKI